MMRGRKNLLIGLFMGNFFLFFYYMFFLQVFTLIGNDGAWKILQIGCRENEIKTFYAHQVAIKSDTTSSRWARREYYALHLCEVGVERLNYHFVPMASGSISVAVHLKLN
jgi:hypothetical protein